MTFSYDPYSLAAMRDPHSFYAELRDNHPAYFLPQYDAWAISRFADVWEGFLDTTSFSEAEGQVIGQQQMLVHHNGICPSAPLEPMSPFVMLDPPIHNRLRQLMAPTFMKPAIGRMTALIEGLVAQRLDMLLPRGRFDLNADFASVISGAAIASIVGLEPDRVPAMVELVNRSVAREPNQPGFTEAGMIALGELNGMLLEVVSGRRAGRGVPTPLIDVFFERDVNGVFLSDQEIAQNLISIIVGGAETVPKIVAGGLWELARRPDQLAAVAADPDNNAPLAVEEMLRYNAPAQWFARTVRQERELAGVQLKVGQRIILLVASANRDPREFDNPDEFIWNRKARRMISFGIGAHFCIGIHLARLETQIMIRELLKRLPRFTVEEAEGEWAVSEFQVGWTRLPVKIAA